MRKIISLWFPLIWIAVYLHLQTSSTTTILEIHTKVRKITKRRNGEDEDNAKQCLTSAELNWNSARVNPYKPGHPLTPGVNALNLIYLAEMSRYGFWTAPPPFRHTYYNQPRFPYRQILKPPPRVNFRHLSAIYYQLSNLNFLPECTGISKLTLAKSWFSKWLSVSLFRSWLKI